MTTGRGAPPRSDIGTEIQATLQKVRQSANGMLPIEVYYHIFESARRANGGNFVEIGTAHGAATIAMALGAKASGKPFHIYTADPFAGRYSSRAEFGTPDENIRHVLAQFQEYGVRDVISLAVGNCETLLNGNDIRKIAFLLIDADGRIDLDLLQLYERLEPGAAVVVDDVDEGVFLRCAADRTYFVDLKHRITCLLLKWMEEKEYLTNRYTIHSTAFCVRGSRSMDQMQFAQLALEAYRQLVFSPLEGERWNDFFRLYEDRGQASRALRLYASVPPVIMRSLGRIHRLGSRLLK